MDPKSWPDRTLSMLPAVLAVLIAASAVGPTGGRAGAVEAPEAVTAAPAAGVRTGLKPPTITASVFAPVGFALAGVTTVDTAQGSRRVLVLTMRKAHLRDYRLSTRDDGANLKLTTTDLTLDGDVRIYLTRLHGCIEGLICLDFAPDALPLPPVIPPFVFMTDVRAEQAFVHADRLTTDIVLTSP
ncbi:hypothetical protein [Embleya sp. NBC_00896]|uniref:hypothetical protein n=1 Tax=Embleya sp. NBC_00896 TaxID=2975961 RepID=UPI002F919D6B|nr:hypothetical protein OG928_40690 [Embleya sp. NBC_00896]